MNRDYVQYHDPGEEVSVLEVMKSEREVCVKDGIGVER